MCPRRCSEQDLADLTGIRVPAKTQQRLVHAQTLALPTEQEAIAELGVDGGKVRVLCAAWGGMSARLQNHCQSIYANIDNESVNYDYFQRCCGLAQSDQSAVECAIKQIDRRIQISGAQWNSANVPQVLAHRCAYLNGLIGSQK